MVRSIRRLGVAAAVPVALVALAGCGGGSSNATTAAASPTTSPGRGGFRNNAEFRKIQQCLQAAGISLPTPSFTRTGPRPSFTGPRPTGSRDFRRGAGGFGMFNDPKVKAALAACGITIPTGRPGGGTGNGSGPAPTASS